MVLDSIGMIRDKRFNTINNHIIKKEEEVNVFENEGLIHILK